MTSALRVFVRRLLLALRYSWQGLREGWRTQASLRYEITAAFLILPLAAWLGRTGVERALLIGSWLLVIAVELINSAIETYNARGATICGGVTAMYEAVLGAQRRYLSGGGTGRLVPSLRMMSGGGAPKPPELFYEVQREMGIPVAHGYGMTEVPMITQGSPLDSDEQLARTEGAPIKSITVRLVTEDGTEAPVGVEGEVRVKGREAPVSLYAVRAEKR